jgi:hypothetical protein
MRGQRVKPIPKAKKLAFSTYFCSLFTFEYMPVRNCRTERLLLNTAWCLCVIGLIHGVPLYTVKNG